MGGRLRVFEGSTVRGGQGPRRRRGARAGRAGHRHRGDHGHLAALEGVFVGVLLVTSVAIVSSMSTRPPSLPTDRVDLQQVVQDLLFALEDLPTGDRFAIAMEKAVMQSHLGNTTLLNSLAERTLPAGSQCRLWLDNGHDKRLLAGNPEKVARQSVSAARLYHPQWKYAVVIPTFENITADAPLDVQGYAVGQGALVKESGIPLVATLQTSQATYDRAAITGVRENVPAASLTLLNETAQPSFLATDPVVYANASQIYSDSAPGPLSPVATFEVPAGTMSLWVNATGRGVTVLYTLDILSPTGAKTTVPVANAGGAPVWANTTITTSETGTWTVYANGTVVGDPPLNLNPASASLTISTVKLVEKTDWTVRVQAETSRPLPEGAKLTLRMPFDFLRTELTPAQAGWRDIHSTVSFQGGTVVTAELDSSVSGSRDFTFHAERNIKDPLILVRAELGNGTAGQATFILGMTAARETTSNPVQRGLYVSVPKPLGKGAASTWGAVFAYPSSLGVGVPETLTSLEVRTADGRALFAGVSGLSPASGWSSPSPDRLWWNGTAILQANKAFAFAARVTVNNATTMDEAPMRMPLTFPSGASSTMGDQVRPYVFTGALAPGAGGYDVPALDLPGPANLLPNATVTAGVAWATRGGLAEGDLSYNVVRFPTLTNLADTMRLGLSRSHITLSKQTVRVGEQVDVTLDFQGLADALQASMGIMPAWELRLSLFDPAQGFESMGKWQPALRFYFGQRLNFSTGTTENYQDLRSQLTPQWPENPGRPMRLESLPQGAEVTYEPEDAPLERSALTALPALPSLEPWVTWPANVESASKATQPVQPSFGAFYGPHAVLGEARFLVTAPDGTQFYATARLLAVLDVVPDGGQAETALYWVSLECWLPDW